MLYYLESMLKFSAPPEIIYLSEKGKESRVIDYRESIFLMRRGQNEVYFGATITF